jgi:hypothetical protein
MVMNAFISEGDRPRSDQGGASAVTGAEGGGAPGGRSARAPMVASSWPSGRRRKTKGWVPRVSEGEGDGWAGPSRLGG